MNHNIGKLLLIAGAASIAIGLMFIYGDKFPVLKHLGKLPGDIRIQKENFTFYFPITTCILLSIIAAVIFRVIAKIK